MADFGSRYPHAIEVRLQFFSRIQRELRQPFRDLSIGVLPYVDPLGSRDQEILGGRQDSVRKHIPSEFCRPFLRCSALAFGFRQKDDASILVIRNEVDVGRHFLKLNSIVTPYRSATSDSTRAARAGPAWSGSSIPVLVPSPGRLSIHIL